jgi:hypothetical protein
MATSGKISNGGVITWVVVKTCLSAQTYGNHPVGQVTSLGYLQGTQDSQVDVATAKAQTYSSSINDIIIIIIISSSHLSLTLESWQTIASWRRVRIPEWL